LRERERERERERVKMERDSTRRGYMSSTHFILGIGSGTVMAGRERAGVFISRERKKRVREKDGEGVREIVLNT